MRIGGPLFDYVSTPEQLVAQHQKYGYSAAYLPMIDDRTLQAEMAAALRQADIVIAEVGAYCINVLDTDPHLRRQNIDVICDRLRLADEHGALCCVMHGGTVQTGGWGAINPQNISQESFDQNVQAIQEIIDAVAPKRAKLVLEAASWLLPDSPEVYLEMFRSVGREQFGVHLDPVNILDSPRACYENAKALRECFDLLGKWIVSCHSKDVLLPKAYLPIEITETFTGQGMLDYDVYLTELDKLPQEPPLMIEHIEAHQIDQAVDFLFGKAASLGIAVRGREHRHAAAGGRK